MNRTRWMLIALCLHLCQRLCIGNPVRLVGPSTNEGRLEIYHNGEWGTVCDDTFDYRDAIVACRMLGYSIGMFTNNIHGEGTGRIWLDDLMCSGNETSLVKCPNRGWGVHNCGHSEDVSVRCELFDVRLVNGTSPNEGRLEIYNDGVWGTVCDDSFDDKDAIVACSMFGYSAGASAGNLYGAGHSEMRIWLDDLNCTGVETTLANCGRNPWGNHNCGHHEDASVRCSGYAATITATRSTTSTTPTVRRTATSSTTTTTSSSSSSSSSSSTTTTTSTSTSLSPLEMESNNSSMSCLLDATVTTPKAVIIGAAAAAVIIVILLVVDITVRCKGQKGKEITEDTSKVVEHGKNELCLADIGVEENAEENLYVEVESNSAAQSPSTSELYENFSVHAKRN